RDTPPAAGSRPLRAAARIAALREPVLCTVGVAERESCVEWRLNSAPRSGDRNEKIGKKLLRAYLNPVFRIVETPIRLAPCAPRGADGMSTGSSTGSSRAGR